MSVKTHTLNKVIFGNEVLIDLTVDAQGATISTPITAGTVLSGYKGYDKNGNCITGTISSPGDQTVNATEQTTAAIGLPSGYYNNNNLTITGLTAAMIAEGSTVFGIPGAHGGALPTEEGSFTPTVAGGEVLPTSGSVFTKVTVVGIPYNETVTTAGQPGYTATIG